MLQGTATLSPPNSVGPEGGSGAVKFVSYAQYSGNNDLHLQASDTGALDAGINWPAILFHDRPRRRGGPGRKVPLGTWEPTNTPSGGGSRRGLEPAACGVSAHQPQ